MSPLDEFNGASIAEAEQRLLSWCGSHAWVRSVLAQRPFRSAESLDTASEAAWFALPEPAWLEAFAAHPRIGESKPPTSGYLAQSAQEQSAAQQTLGPFAARLIEMNDLYEQRFGFRYIVFASGRSAPELLRILELRITQTSAEELQEAARQQQRITQLRMTKWLHS